MGNYSLNQNATKVMFTSATPETVYPTGVTIGLKGQADAAAGDVNGAADTRTLTNTSSIYAPQTGVQPQKHAIIRSISILVVGAAGTPAISFEDYGGQKVIIPAMTTTALGTISFGSGGIFVNGGFRVVNAGTTAAICAITYDLVTN